MASAMVAVNHVCPLSRRDVMTRLDPSWRAASMTVHPNRAYALAKTFRPGARVRHLAHRLSLRDRPQIAVDRSFYSLRSARRCAGLPAPGGSTVRGERLRADVAAMPGQSRSSEWRASSSIARIPRRRGTRCIGRGRRLWCSNRSRAPSAEFASLGYVKHVLGCVEQFVRCCLAGVRHLAHLEYPSCRSSCPVW